MIIVLISLPTTLVNLDDNLLSTLFIKLLRASSLNGAAIFILSSIDIIPCSNNTCVADSFRVSTAPIFNPVKSIIASSGVFPSTNPNSRENTSSCAIVVLFAYCSAIDSNSSNISGITSFFPN